MNTFLKIIIILLCGAVSTNATADTPSNNLPRFVSLKNQEVNLRAGPGYRYPIKWVYKKRFMPVEVIEERGTWRKIKDIDGEEGWAHSTQISGKRTALPLQDVTVKRFPAQDAPPSFRAGKGIVLHLQSCDQNWCHIAFDSHAGWVQKSALWGVYAHELVGK